MLYPLSYEGLCYVLLSVPAGSRSVELGQGTLLLTACAAPVPQAVG